MPRKTGEQGKVVVEVGTTFYAMGELSTVSSPAADVGKRYITSAEYMSDQKKLQPKVRLDGVVSGLVIIPSSTDNAVEISEGEVYIKGETIEVNSVTVSGLIRPLQQGNVRITALTVNANGTINGTIGTEGSSGGARGAAGGNPFIPVDTVLIGYINMTYYGGSGSGEDVVETGEIDSETKERAILPSYQVVYHDGKGDSPENVGVIKFASQLPEIHAATAGGPGTARRNVYCSYYDATFEEIAETMDFGFTEDIEVITSRAYQDEAEQKDPSIPSWSMSGSAYWSKVQDVLNLIKNTKRWVKLYPDKDETDHWVGRGVIKVDRNVPLAGNLDASISIDGSGVLYDKAS